MSLTPKEIEILSRPFPKDVVKSFKGKGGKTMRYIDVDVIEARLAEVDADFNKDVLPGARSVAVHYTLKGVRRGDLFDNDSESNKYGAPQVNALARASRRAARLFGVGKDLWEDDDADDEEDDEKPARRSSKAPAKVSGKRSNKPVTLSEGQLTIMKEKGFRKADIARIGSFDIVGAAIQASKDAKLGRGEPLDREDIEDLLKQYGVLAKGAAAVEDEDDENEDDYEE